MLGASKHVSVRSSQKDLIKANPKMSRRRSGTVRVLAVLGLFTFGLSVMIVLQEVLNPVADEAHLVAAGSAEAQLGADHPNESVHVGGALVVFLMGGSGLIALVVQPSRPGSARQTVATMLGSIAVMGIMGDPDNHGAMAGPFDVAMLLFAVPALAAGLAACSWQTEPRASVEHTKFLVLALIGVPFLWYGIDQALIQRRTWPPLADPHHQAHWYMMGVLGFMIVFSVAAAAFGGRGWWAASSSAGIAALALGCFSLLIRAAASALPWPWALAAMGWGLAVLRMTASTANDSSGFRQNVGTASLT